MIDPLDIARAVWPGEWTRQVSPGAHEALVLELPDPFTDQPGSCWVRVDAEEEGGWWVSVRIQGEVAEIHGEDLAETLELARTTTVREFAPLLRALGADLITAALAPGVDVRRCPECDHSNGPDPAFAEGGGGLVVRFHSATSCYECGAELTQADLDPEFTIGGVVATGLRADGEEWP